MIKKCFFLFSFVTLFGLDTDVLFVMQDAGETNAFIPVIEKMQEAGKDYLILAEGTAVKLLDGASIPSSRVKSFSEFGITVEPIWGRTQRFTRGDLKKLTKGISPMLVVTGVAYEIQGQILEAFGSRDVTTVAFWDNFGASGDSPYFKVAHRVAMHASKVFFPSTDVAKDSTFAHLKKEDAMVVGHPTLDIWRAIRATLPQEKRRELGLNKKPLIAYIGGYGEDYEEGFSLYLSCVTEADVANYQTLIVPHPKTDGQFEKAELKRHRGLLPEINMIDGVGAKDAVAAADVVVCHQSSVGFQAASANKRVIFLIPEHQKFSNLAIQKGVAKLVTSKSAFIREMRHGADLKPFSFYKTLGVPEHSTDVLFHALLYFMN